MAKNSKLEKILSTSIVLTSLASPDSISLKIKEKDMIAPEPYVSIEATPTKVNGRDTLMWTIERGRTNAQYRVKVPIFNPKEGTYRMTTFFVDKKDYNKYNYESILDTSQATGDPKNYETVLFKKRFSILELLKSFDWYKKQK